MWTSLIPPTRLDMKFAFFVYENANFTLNWVFSQAEGIFFFLHMNELYELHIKFHRDLRPFLECSHVCGNQNRYFKPPCFHEPNQTNTMCLFSRFGLQFSSVELLSFSFAWPHCQPFLISVIFFSNYIYTSSEDVLLWQDLRCGSVITVWYFSNY